MTHFEQITLIRVFNSLRRRWKIILLLFALGVVFAYVYLLRQVPVYEAVATVELHLGERSPADAVKILNSRSMAEAVARRMNLDWQIVGQSQGLDVEIGRFAVSGTLSGLQVRLDEPPDYRVYDQAGRFIGEGRSGKPFRGDGADLLLEIRNGQPGQQLTLEHRPRALHAERLYENLTVVPLGSSSKLVRVHSRDTDPVHARDVANILVETYREQLAEQESRTLQSIGEQVRQAHEALETDQLQLQNLMASSGLTDLLPQGELLALTPNKLQQRKSALEKQIKSVDGMIDRLRQAIKNDTQLMPPPIVGSSSETLQLADRLADLETTRMELLVNYTERHPDVIEIDEQISQVRKSLLELYENWALELSAEKAKADQALSRIADRNENRPDVEILKLEQQRKADTELLASLQKRQRDLQMVQNLAADQVKVIDSAVTPQHPIAPERPKVLAIGGATGLLVGLLAAFLLSALDRRFNTVEEVQDKLNLPIYGVIPRIPAVDNDRGVPVAVQMPKAPVVEAFRALRTRIHAVTGKEKHKIILVTSSLPGEGKSTISTNLAVVLGLAGAKVLLIGCDLRRPTLHEKFGQTNVPGLVDLMNGNQQEALRHIAKPRIDFLPAGTIPDNPSELLDSEKMRNLLSMVRSRYDYVVIDAPPVLPVTDAEILSPLADLTLAVLEPCRVPEKAAMQMVESLQAVGAVIDGVVINDRMGKGFKYYGSYSYYGNKNYSGYYGENPDDLVDGVVVRGVRKVWEKLNS